MKVLKYIHAIYVPYIKFHQLFLYIQNFWVSGFNMNQGDRSEPPKLPKRVCGCVWVCVYVCVCVFVCSMCVLGIDIFLQVMDVFHPSFSL